MNGSCEYKDTCPVECFHKEEHRVGQFCKGICKNGPSVCVRSNEEDRK